MLTHQATQANPGSYLGCTQDGKEGAASWVLSSVASGEARSYLVEANMDHQEHPHSLCGTSTLIGQCLSHAGGQIF